MTNATAATIAQPAPTVTDAEVQAKIAQLTAGYALKCTPRYNPDIWRRDREKPDGYVPYAWREKTHGTVHIELIERADVERMARALGAEAEQECHVGEGLKPGDWWVRRRNFVRADHWLPNITLIAEFEESRNAPKPRAPRPRRAVTR